MSEKPPDNASYESEKDRLIREIQDIKNYLEFLEAKLDELYKREQL